MMVIKIFITVLKYIGVMFSVSLAVAIGVKAGLKTYFDNKSSKGGN